MKNFFTSMLGTLVALIIFTVCSGLLMIGVLGALAAMGGGHKTNVEAGSYLVLDLSSAITEAPPTVDFRFLGSNRPPSLQLRTITRALRAAATDDRIVGVLLKGDALPTGYGGGLGTLKEVRGALLQFKKSGKPVKAYLTYATTRNYYLASTANEIDLDPFGLIIMPGLATQSTFWTGLFEKYGIDVQVTRVGKYKSYVEAFTRKDMSPEDREQLQKLLDDLWTGVVADIGDTRKLKPAEIQATVDREGLITADAAKAAHLVDKLSYRDEVIDSLKRETGRAASSNTFKQVSVSDYARDIGDLAGSGNPSGGKADSVRGGKIAVVYAQGEIVDGEGDGDNEIGGTRFSRELRKLRHDADVKAIVLRVNSPGGTISASEAIQREIRLAKKVKPVIISMGSYAASGGYWISAYGDRIFAEPTTVTGSIGVFGIQFDIQKLANNFGVTFDGVKTGKFADAITITRPKSPEEMEIFQRIVDHGYNQFVAKVADGRHLKRDYVEEIAQGRVWSGLEAKKIGLVDELGGLDTAIRYAAKKAGLGDNYRIDEFPRKKDFAQALQEAIEKIAPDGHAQTGVIGQIEARLEKEFAQLRVFNDPQGLYAIMPMNLEIH